MGVVKNLNFSLAVLIGFNHLLEEFYLQSVTDVSHLLHPLTRQQLIALAKNKQNSRDLAREKFIATFKKRRLEHLRKVLDQQSTKLLPLTPKELLIAGLFLYWGEGAKKRGTVSISNTDPRVVKFALYWMVEILKIPIEKVRVNLHVYKDMNVEEVIEFWSKKLDIPRSQFMKPYTKKTNRSGLSYKSFGHGTCRLYAGNTKISEEIAMAIKSIAEYYGEKSELFWYN